MGILETICAIAYLCNIFKLIMNGFNLLRVIGIFIPPIGAVMGFL